MADVKVDYDCPICMRIMIKVVTMPCSHELCLPCFTSNVQESSLCCPFCRTRISSWSRKAARTNTLINHQKWDEIKQKFPDKVQMRLEDRDDVTDDKEYNILVSEPGAIRDEYKAEQAKFQNELTEERLKEEQQSKELIAVLAREEESVLKKLREVEQQDRELAVQLNKEYQENEKLLKATQQKERKSTKGQLTEYFKAATTSPVVAAQTSALSPTSDDSKIQGFSRPASASSSLQEWLFGASTSSQDAEQATEVPRVTSRIESDAEDFGTPRPKDKENHWWAGRRGAFKAASSRARDAAARRDMKSKDDSQRERSRSTESRESHDSLAPDLNHFKPLQRFPVSPPPPGAKKVQPIQCQPTNTRPKRAASRASRNSKAQQQALGVLSKQGSEAVRRGIRSLENLHRLRKTSIDRHTSTDSPADKRPDSIIKRPTSTAALDKRPTSIIKRPIAVVADSSTSPSRACGVAHSTPQAGSQASSPYLTESSLGAPSSIIYTESPSDSELNVENGSVSVQSSRLSESTWMSDVEGFSSVTSDRNSPTNRKRQRSGSSERSSKISRLSDSTAEREDSTLSYLEQEQLFLKQLEERRKQEEADAKLAKYVQEHPSPVKVTNGVRVKVVPYRLRHRSGNNPQ